MTKTTAQMQSQRQSSPQTKQQQRPGTPQQDQSKEGEGGDVIIKIEPFIISASTSAGSSTINDNRKNSNKIKYCSFVLKLVGFLIIVGIVLLFALLPNYLRNKSAQDLISIENNTGPTNARLPTD